MGPAVPLRVEKCQMFQGEVENLVHLQREKSVKSQRKHILLEEYGALSRVFLFVSDWKNVRCSSYMFQVLVYG
jgi:hypothetical protein